MLDDTCRRDLPIGRVAAKLLRKSSNTSIGTRLELTYKVKSYEGTEGDGEKGVWGMGRLAR